MNKPLSSLFSLATLSQQTIQAFADAALPPPRVIPNEHGPYLSRYTLDSTGSTGEGHLFLHHFHADDASQELHSHPWSGTSLILAGSYMEERMVNGSIRERVLNPGDVNKLEPDTFHRVELLDQERGVWTLFAVGARVQEWSFMDRSTGKLTPWRDALVARGLLT